MDSPDDLLERALSLPVEDRRRLARALIISLDRDQDEEQVDTAWREEIGRRVEQILDGQVEMIDGEEAHARLRAHLRAIR
jgi:putative addiction module component (TIGR02574 family)